MLTASAGSPAVELGGDAGDVVEDIRDARPAVDSGERVALDGRAPVAALAGRGVGGDDLDRIEEERLLAGLLRGRHHSEGGHERRDGRDRTVCTAGHRSRSSFGQRRK